MATKIVTLRQVNGAKLAIESINGNPGLLESLSNLLSTMMRIKRQEIEIDAETADSIVRLERMHTLQKMSHRR